MNHSTKGFTIIELMLAMSFLSMLLLGIAMTTIQIGRTYTKGVTLREVNQAGRSVSDDLRRTVGSAMPFDLATSLISQDGGNGGRLCLGDYTYVWNTGRALASNIGPNVYNDSTNTPVQFAKVRDSRGQLCANPGVKITRADASELLANGDRSLVLQAITVTSATGSIADSRALYSISMNIGTNDQSLLETGDKSCKVPTDAAGGDSYCSVNQFDLVIRAGNNTRKDS